VITSGRKRIWLAQRWGLVSHWAGDGLTDSYGTNTLTNNGVATFTSGKVGNAFTLVAASSQYLSRASAADLNPGNNDFWLAAWVKLATKPAVAGVMCKYNSGGNNKGFSLYYVGGATDRFRFLVSNDGSADVIVTADTFGAPSDSTWYFLFAYHDAASNTINISVNGGAFDSLAHTTGVFDSTADFTVGQGDLVGPTFFWDGQIDEASYGKSTPGGIASRATEIRDQLYNGGNGRTFTWA